MPRQADKSCRVEVQKGGVAQIQMNVKIAVRKKNSHRRLIIRNIRKICKAPIAIKMEAIQKNLHI